MTFRRRVATIYRKELIDILRDRRTLIAMIVVPIVLYPLLMLGSIQAVTHQAVSLEEEGFVIGVLSRQDAVVLERLIALDEEALNTQHEAEREAAEGRGEPAPTRAAPGSAWEKVRLATIDSEDELRRRVQDRAIQVGVVFRELAPLDRPDLQTVVEFFVDEEEVRSVTARNRLRSLLTRTDERITADRIAAEGLPPNFARPIRTTSQNLSAPSSILGQVLPLILVLMTITGAIYPAIDLTAGERERNTLESLMVCPVPVLELIVGKFLVVTTVAIMGATLNLSSVTATVYLGGFREVIASDGGAIPVGKMAAILASLVPFAVLMSAIMIAVCSYARTFKEAQNYVTPVIIAVLIPGGIAALPATRLEGMMLIMPVGNMVLFARDMLLGADVAAWKTLSVIISTTLYASAAVAIAASVFGRESVVFSDAGSLKTTFARRLFRPSATPKVSMVLLLVALLFPTWFFVQTALQPQPGEDAAMLLYGTGLAMPLLFVLLPWAILAYWKVSPRETFALRAPHASHILAGLMLGASTWILAHEFTVLQNAIFPVPRTLQESNALLTESLMALPGWHALLLLAVLPAICEELLFRGFLMSGLRGATARATCVVVTAVVFGTFHFIIFKMPLTVALGVVLGLLCWHARSILPGIVMHVMHNGLLISMVLWPRLGTALGVTAGEESGHLPLHLVLPALVLTAAGLLLTLRSSPPAEQARAA